MFKFTPVCCCGSTNPNSPCIAGCEMVYDGLLNTDSTPVSSLLPLIRAARECEDELYWHGFYYSPPNLIPTSHLTTDQGWANTLIHVVGYSGGIRDGIDPVSVGQNLGTDISDKLKDTNNNTGIAAYFIFDNKDSKIHYDPAVVEPAWITVYSIPWDYAAYPIEFQTIDDTEAAWNAASPIPYPVSGYLALQAYDTPTDCGFYPLSVSADFPSSIVHTVFHSGTTSNYLVEANQIDTWLSSLIGQRHYGSDYFWLDYCGFEASYGACTYTERENYLYQCVVSLKGAEVSKDTIRGRFNRDTPNFTPMLPIGKYSTSQTEQKVDPDTQTPYTSYLSFESSNTKPSSWGGTSSGFIGKCYTKARGYSYGNSESGFVSNFTMFPLGRYKYDKPPQMDMSGALVRRSTQPCMIRPPTASKSVNDFVFDDFKFVIPSGSSSTTTYDKRLPLIYADEYDPGDLIGFIPNVIVFTSTPTTPTQLLHGNLAFGHRATYWTGGVISDRWGYGNRYSTSSGYSYDGTGVGWVTSRQPAAVGEVIDTDSSSVASYSIGTNNNYMTSFDLGWRLMERNGRDTLIPYIPPTILSNLTQNIHIWTDANTTSPNYDWYFYPCIWISGFCPHSI